MEPQICDEKHHTWQMDMTVYFVTLYQALSGLNGLIGIHDEHKCQSVTTYIGSTNVWREIHDVFSNFHGKLIVTHFRLSMTKVNHHV